MSSFSDFTARGKSLYDQGKYLAALEFFMIGAESDDVESSILLAKTYIKLDNTFEAKKTLYKILAAEPEQKEATEMLEQLMSGSVEKKSTNSSAESNQEAIGVFSVGENKKVAFSPGNLQFQASTMMYRFAPEQYDAILGDNDKISSQYDGWIDLFGWGTGNCPYKDSADKAVYMDFSDWSDYMPGWRLLSVDEWAVLIANHRGGLATVCSQEGWLMLPDDSTVLLNDQCKYYSDNVIEEPRFRELESLGCVFLPTTGSRYDHEIENRNNGFYHVLDFDGDELIRCVRFMDRGNRSFSFRLQLSSTHRFLGQAVRLVKDIK